MYPLWIVLIAIPVGILAFLAATASVRRVEWLLDQERAHGVAESAEVGRIELPGQVLIALVSVSVYVLLARLGAGFEALACITASTLLWIMAFVDGRTAILPDSMTGSFLWLALLWQIHQNPEHIPSMETCLASLGAFLVPVMVNAVYRRCRRIDAVGLGDAKLLAGLVMWFGPSALGWILVKSLRWCLLYTVGRSMVEERMPVALPMGPFFAVSANIWMLTYV
ncbi:prepilin peptidase [Orrella marina]|uniref:Prepilin type IV endopeptidase peptidase domain-containing protein n=1 Tax=Orrella marina TaxID=2163011 RepID=A0A2R4XMU5_9BURK|nr:A24 family peptidase [Orrella marina]AWB35136.1 hypothetical protein DBV39_16945 [Orrella marina]